MKKITLIALLFSVAIVKAQTTVSSTSFEEPTAASQYVDTGDANVAHDLINNAGQSMVDFTTTATEMGFDARYEPYDTPDVGLTDGDFVGATSFTGDVGAYTDGVQGYNLSDTDGNMILEFDVVDFSGLTNPTVSIDYFITETGYEGDGTVNESGSDRIRIYVKDLTNNTEIDILNTEGSDIDDLGIEGVFTTGTATVPNGVMVQLVVEVRTNAGGEAVYLDNVKFEATGTFDLNITEVFPGQEGDDLTADWFEIRNDGNAAWVSGVDPDLYYDDESADGATADIIQGITNIQPGEYVIVLVTDNTNNEVATFTNVWGEVVNLSGLEIGFTDGAGLGGGGDAVNIWAGDPTSTSVIDTATYPDTVTNDGQSFDVDLNEFSTVGNTSNAVETLQQGGAASNVPNIGSPGNVPLMPNLVITEVFAGQEGTDLTEDWFEIKNEGQAAWVSGIDADLYYDDESADGNAADIIQGLTDIQPGEYVIVLVTDNANGEVATFVDVWDDVVDLTNVEVGFTDGAGLGQGGDSVTLWMGDPTTTLPVDMGAYPDTAANDGESYDIELASFSVAGNANGAVATLLLGGTASDTPNIGSPGNVIPNVNVEVAFDGAFTSVSEDGAEVTISIIISEAPDTEGTVEVALLTGGTAVEGTDFTFSATETITFPVGSTTPQEITIPIINNTEDGSDVFFIVRLANATTLQIGENDTFSTYILDDDTQVPTGDATQLDMNYLASYVVDADGTAEIVAYDPASQQLFVTNADKVEVLDFSDPSNITSLATVTLPAGTSGVQSVAVNNGIVAAAVAADPATNNGFVVFSDTNGANQTMVEVGSLPDMLTFSPDGNYVLVANEGQPNDDYTIDPEGSVSIIDVSGGLGAISQSNVSTANFNAFDAQQATLEADGVRIYGPGATVSQDLEPEYITVSADSQTAYVTLQENNAYAIVDIANAEISEIISFGLKDHSIAENSLDVSNDTDFIFDASWPIKGLYMPDAISFYSANGTDYIVTANEGDAREYNALEEERNLGDADYILDPTVFSNIDVLEMESNLGAINLTNASGDTDDDGDFDEIHVFGGRSFSIFEAVTGTLVYDSGNDFEIITANDPTYGPIFNASNSNNSYKDRSDNKGPEPEGVLVQEINGEQYAFILLERIGGVMVYNITDPTNPVFLQYLNNREATPGGDEMGDLGPEGLVYVPFADSPTNTGLIVVANEVSGTLSIYSLDNDVLGVDEFELANNTNFSMYPNPANGIVFLSKRGDYTIYDVTGRKINQYTNVTSLDIQGLTAGIYVVVNQDGVAKRLIVK
ncbi:choice-of-anchor I family protein [Marinirhabdus gelatinilytica]|uniref:Putative secreted protein (Por secretion system target) n=1 Tax=Marinirhabdus gelatinilytica TaxID=1703343 RepID=A0A370QFU8_9FLAO|nr:choice-of-anchor I family protein [Marinirhabdus gelatinilytica]RDK87237.1 putative secreted protein (Por secretion system target) [Marinirhabdus gelatinilytica]